MFYDLNVLRPKESEIKDLIAYFEQNNYGAIAFTTEVKDEVFLPENVGKKKKQLKGDHSVPEPLDVSKYSSKRLTVYNRINIIVNKANAFHNISQSPTVKQYDIVSIQPGSDGILKTLSGMTNFEILSYNPVLEENELYFNRKTYQKFVNNGIFMELAYRYPMLDSSNRRMMIQRAHIFRCVGGGKNIVISSGTQDIRRLRSPHDVINLSFIFSLNEEEAKAAITRNCEKILLLARTRRRAKCAIEMTLIQKKTEDSSSCDQKNNNETSPKRMKKQKLNERNADAFLGDNAHHSSSITQPVIILDGP